MSDQLGLAWRRGSVSRPTYNGASLAPQQGAASWPDVCVCVSAWRRPAPAHPCAGRPRARGPPAKPGARTRLGGGGGAQNSCARRALVCLCVCLHHNRGNHRNRVAGADEPPRAAQIMKNLHELRAHISLRLIQISGPNQIRRARGGRARGRARAPVTWARQVARARQGHLAPAQVSWGAMGERQREIRNEEMRAAPE